MHAGCSKTCVAPQFQGHFGIEVRRLSEVAQQGLNLAHAARAAQGHADCGLGEDKGEGDIGEWNVVLARRLCGSSLTAS